MIVLPLNLIVLITESCIYVFVFSVTVDCKKTVVSYSSLLLVKSKEHMVNIIYSNGAFFFNVRDFSVLDDFFLIL